MLGVDADNPNGALGLYKGLGFEADSRLEIFGWPPTGDPVGAGPLGASE
jgi:hypothetical protein